MNKATCKEDSSSPQVQKNVLNTALGLAAGIITKKVFVTFSASPVKKWLGTALMVGVTHYIAMHPEVVKSWIKKLVDAIRDKPVNHIKRSAQNESGKSGS